MNYILILCLFLQASCAMRSPGRSEISKLSAIQAFDSHDYAQAIAQFGTLSQENPDDKVLKNYLAQSYIGRAGISLGEISKSIIKLEKSGNESMQIISDFLKDLPPSNGSVRSDLAEAVNIIQRFNEKHDNEEMRKNEVIYRMLYMAYLVKSVHDNILKAEGLTDLKEVRNALKTAVKSNYAELTEIVFQFRGILGGLDNVTGKLKNKVKKFTEQKTFTITYNKKQYTIDINSGFEKGIDAFVTDIMDNDYNYYKNLVIQIRNKIDASIEKLKGTPEYERLRKDAEDALNLIREEIKIFKDTPEYQSILDLINEIKQKF